MKPVHVTFKCPYRECDWPCCIGEDNHTLCDVAVRQAKRGVVIYARPISKEPK